MGYKFRLNKYDRNDAYFVFMKKKYNFTFFDMQVFNHDQFSIDWKEADYNKNIATPNNSRTYFTNSQSLSNIEERSADTIEETTNLLRQNDDKSKRSGSESSEENDQVTFNT